MSNLTCSSGNVSPRRTLNETFTLSKRQTIHFLVPHYLPKSEIERNACDVSNLGFFNFLRISGTQN